MKKQKSVRKYAFSPRDQHIPQPASRKAVGAVMGETGLRRSGGYITEDFLPQLNGTRAAAVFKEMSLNDPIAGAAIYAITALVRQVEWSVIPADDSGKSKKGKQFLEEVINDMRVPWSDLMSEVVTMFVYGYAPFEIIYKFRRGPKSGAKDGSLYSDGKLGIDRLSLRAQDTIHRWDMSEDGDDIYGFEQMTVTRGTLLVPMSRCLLFRTTKEKNNPEGRSILRNAYRPWLFKNRMEEIEAIGAERDLAGLPVIKLPSELLNHQNDPEKMTALAQYKQLITQIKRDTQEGVVLPSDRDEHGHLYYELELLTTGGQRQFDTNKIIDRYDLRISMSMLADFLFLGQQRVGSFALSSDKTNLFSSALGAFLRTIKDTLNTDLIPKLWRLNGLPDKNMPKLAHGDIETPDLTQMAQFIFSMARSGAPLFPDADLENRLRGFANLPPRPITAGEGTLATPTTSASTSNPTPGGAPAINGNTGQTTESGGTASATPKPEVSKAFFEAFQKFLSEHPLEE